MNELIYTKARVEQGAKGKMRIIASTEAMDRDGEIVKVDGWDLKAFKENPVFLWAHNHRELPLGRFSSIKKDKVNKRLIGEIEWASAEANPMSPRVQAQFAEGIMTTFSVGFIPKERDENRPNIITKAELLEVSAVPVPANPEALVLMTAKGMNKDMFTFNVKEMIDFIGATKFNATQLADYVIEKWQKKTIIPYVKYKLAGKGDDWNEKLAKANVKDWATTEEDVVDVAEYGKAFTWIDNKGKELDKYKLLHHDYQNGLVTVWRGTVRAMAEVLDSKSDIPAEERRGAYNHLAKHYKEFGEEAPKFASYSEAELKEMFGELNETKDEDIKKNLELVTTKDFKEIISNMTTALQSLIAGSDKAIENGGTIEELSLEEREELKTNLKIGKLLAESVMRKLNQRRNI